MAGSHKVRVSKPGSGQQFEATVRPERIFNRVPIFGPFFTFNLGRNPRFVVVVKHLGYSPSGYGDDLIPGMVPGHDESDAWEFDLVLMVDGEPMTHSEDLLIDVTTKPQSILTGPWPLTQSGRAELQIGPLPTGYLSLFSFEVKDNTVTAANWVFGLFTGVAGVVIGAVLALLLSSD